MELKAITGLIDHALLHPTLTDEEVVRGCELAASYAVASVCVKPCHVPLAANVLGGCGVLTGTVIGFPHGGSAVEVKRYEIRAAIAAGAEEIDAVVNVGKVLSADWEYVDHELRLLQAACRRGGVKLKLIFETDYLTSREAKIRLCNSCVAAGIAFVKTSTGFGYVKNPAGSFESQGATDDDLRLMLQCVAGRAQVKASGGIRTLEDVLRVKALGVTRVGTSATETIVLEAQTSGIT